MLTDRKDEKSERHYFDVEKYRQIHAHSHRPKGRVERVTSRANWVITSHQGLITGVLFTMLPLGLLLGIVLTVSYGGGLAFYVAVAAFFIVAAIVGEKRVTSAQFSESHFLRKIAAQILAYSVIAGLFLLLLFEVGPRFH